MEVNCIVFPSPNKYNLAGIQHHIILIPHESTDNQHSLYRSTISQAFSQGDEFTDYLNSFTGKSTPKTTGESERNHCNNEPQKTLENEARLEGNLNISQKVKQNQYIPCLFLSGVKDKLIIFFHANGEDISTAYEFLRMVNLEMKYPILAMEYRGYSLYEGKTTPQNIEKDAERVMQFLLANKISSDQIIIFGRSIGCAVSLTVTQKYSVYCSVLLSPFISLKKIAKDMYGGCASMVIKEAFDNEQNCKKIKCPCLIIHGSKDTLVPFDHSLKLMSGCQSYCRLKVVENMTHTKFNFRLDFIRHLNRFLLDIE